MRRSALALETRVAFDQAKFVAGVRSGAIKAADLIGQLKVNRGVHFDQVGDMHITPFVLDGQGRLATDAQPELVTVMNAGIPAFLSNWLDPKLIEVLVTPMKAAEIAGETQKGDWLTTVATFVVAEMTGEVSAYGDYNTNGSANTNLNFPQRQAFLYQTISQWGQRELENAGLAKVDLAARINQASVLVLNKFQNQSYFFGITGLANYGMLNSPDLSAPIAPVVAWDSATAEQIYADVLRLFKLLNNQANGLIDQDAKMTMALSNNNSPNLNKTNQYNVNVIDQIRKNFPNIRVMTAPEYSTTSGELVQLIVDEVEGQETWTNAFTEKLRAHNMVTDLSSYKQKKSQGTFGCVIFRPVFIAQMLG